MKWKEKRSYPFGPLVICIKILFLILHFSFRLSSYSLHGCQPVARVGVSSKIEK